MHSELFCGKIPPRQSTVPSLMGTGAFRKTLGVLFKARNFSVGYKEGQKKSGLAFRKMSMGAGWLILIEVFSLPMRRCLI